MDIRRIVTNISSEKMEESKEFYTDFLGLNIVMDMEWILTFASASNPAAQITIVKKVKPNVADSDITIFVEVNDIDNLYARAIALDYKIAYPITNESWGVRRFFVKDPNGVIINLMCHLPSSNKQ
jgi:predicted enzyme related to lactoylglutathione lyase